jgi:hypothetical protein
MFIVIAVNEAGTEFVNILPTYKVKEVPEDYQDSRKKIYASREEAEIEAKALNYESERTWRRM